MSWIKEFKDFASRGNLVDVAVAFVIGGAFGKIVSTFTGGIVSPLISLITGGVNFEDKQYILKEATSKVDETGAIVEETVAVAIQYGSFITAVIDFLIVAFVMFLVIKAVNKMKKKQEAAPPPGPSSTDLLLMEIRDALKK